MGRSYCLHEFPIRLIPEEITISPIVQTKTNTLLTAEREDAILIES